MPSTGRCNAIGQHLGSLRLLKQQKGTLRGMGQPKTVSYRNLDAQITYSEKDNLFHGYWNVGGEHGKRAFRMLERTKRKTLDASRRHAGRDCPECLLP